MLPSRWPMTCVLWMIPLLVATVSGCSRSESTEEKPSEFDLVTGPNGFLTYRSRSSAPLDSAGSVPAATDPQVPAPEGSLQRVVQQEQLDERQRRQQLDDEAFRQLRKARQEWAKQQREEQAAEDAYQKQRRKLVQAQAQRERQWQLHHDQQQKQWLDQNGQAAEAESARLQQGSQQLDGRLQQTQRQQQQEMILRQQLNQSKIGGVPQPPARRNPATTPY